MLHLQFCSIQSFFSVPHLKTFPRLVEFGTVSVLKMLHIVDSGTFKSSAVDLLHSPGSTHRLMFSIISPVSFCSPLAFAHSL